MSMPCSPTRSARVISFSQDVPRGPFGSSIVASERHFGYLALLGQRKAKHEIDEKTQTLLNDAYRHAAEYLRRGFLKCEGESHPIAIWTCIFVGPKLYKILV